MFSIWDTVQPADAQIGVPAATTPLEGGEGSTGQLPKTLPDHTVCVWGGITLEVTAHTYITALPGNAKLRPWQCPSGKDKNEWLATKEQQSSEEREEPGRRGADWNREKGSRWAQGAQPFGDSPTLTNPSHSCKPLPTLAQHSSTKMSFDPQTLHAFRGFRHRRLHKIGLRDCENSARLF